MQKANMHLNVFSSIKPHRKMPINPANDCPNRSSHREIANIAVNCVETRPEVLSLMFRAISNKCDIAFRTCSLHPICIYTRVHKMWYVM